MSDERFGAHSEAGQPRPENQNTGLAQIGSLNLLGVL